jgi:Fic family protein
MDRQESPALMEPMRLSEGSRQRAELSDLVIDLAQKSAGLRRSLPSGIMETLASLIREMNCYYSNLIEGHYTHPTDIANAQHNDYSDDPEKRNLQLEATAHITVQRWIDEGNPGSEATTQEAILEIHRRFTELLPEELRWAEDPDTGEKCEVIPGELRHRNVKVGGHLAISPGSLPRFMARFEKAYTGLGKSEVILSAAAAHHRLLWIHPFLDGNGRVARLMSYATLLNALDTGGIWSIARGLSRTVRDYKRHLAACDMPRRNDLDGRGTLSEENLAAFTRFFLEVCIDQVRFMESLVQPERLRTRILRWTERGIEAKRLLPKSERVLDAVLYRGELPRGDVPEILATGERHARRIVSALLTEGVLTSPTNRAPLRLAFPAKLAPHWLPGLFPEPPN